MGILDIGCDDFKRTTRHHNVWGETFIDRLYCVNYVIIFFFFYKEDLLTYKNLQKYATKYIHMYNMKYNKMAA